MLVRESVEHRPSERGGTWVRYDINPCMCGRSDSWFNADVTRAGVRVVVACRGWRPWTFWRHDIPDVHYAPHAKPGDGEELVLEGRTVRLPVPPF